MRRAEPGAGKQSPASGSQNQGRRALSAESRFQCSSLLLRRGEPGTPSPGRRTLTQTLNAEVRVWSPVPRWQKPERTARSRVFRVGLPEPGALPQAPLTGFANKCRPLAPGCPQGEGLGRGLELGPDDSMREGGPGVQPEPQDKRNTGAELQK